MRSEKLTARDTVSLTGLITALGVAFGGLGTSPLYVMKAILAGSEGIVNQDFIIGIVSCLIWTLTLLTTIKYVFITIRADNNGEGGIMALYALVRKNNKGLFFVAILGSSTLLAEGVITPSITIISAAEGLQVKFPDFSALPVAMVILTALFVLQKFGAGKIDRFFGPVMLLWFIVLAAAGLPYLVEMPVILKAFNPLYAIRILVQYPGGLVLMGAVFLVTTGAEAIVTDLVHCGYKNIRISWLFVKITLVVNYMGQAAWIFKQNMPAGELPNPFFSIMPAWFLPFGVVMAVAASLIAGRTMLRGFFTIVSEAISLNFWPKLRVSYPTNYKDHLYIPTINWMFFAACMAVLLLFKNSSNMAAAYGLATIITMIMTTILMAVYLKNKSDHKSLPLLFTVTFLFIEGGFLLANGVKFLHGGWLTLLVAGIAVYVMSVWFSARRIKNRLTRFVRIADYYQHFKDLSQDQSVPKYATNLVYLTRANLITDVESKIIYSIFQKSPKRADTYWLLHVNICDAPHTMEYCVDQMIPGTLIRIEFRLGFKVQPRINLLFNEVIRELACENEIDLLSRYPSLRKHDMPADFRFIVIHRIQNRDFNLPRLEQFVLDQYSILYHMTLSDIKTYGLDSSNVMVEVVPLAIPINGQHFLKRVYHEVK